MEHLPQDLISTLRESLLVLDCDMRVQMGTTRASIQAWELGWPFAAVSSNGTAAA